MVLFVLGLVLSFSTCLNAALYVEGISRNPGFDFSGSGELFECIGFEGDIIIISDSGTMLDGVAIYQVDFTLYSYFSDEPLVSGDRFIEPVDDGLAHILIDDPTLTMTHIEYFINPLMEEGISLGTVYTFGMGERLIITANYGTIEIANILFVPEPASLAILAAGSLLAVRRK